MNFVSKKLKGAMEEENLMAYIKAKETVQKNSFYDNKIQYD